MIKDLVSIIVPVFNDEIYLKNCLDSIVRQTYSNLEIILVDDGSKDLSGKICDDYAMKDSRIKVIHQQNKGVSKARNKGLSLACGEYVSFVDGDDTIDQNYILVMYVEMKKGNFDVVRLSWERGGRNYTYNDVAFDSEGKCVIDERNFDNLKWCANIWGLFKNNQDIRFNEYLKNGEDSLFVIEHFVKSEYRKMLLINKPFYHYTVVPKSASMLSAADRVVAHELFLQQVLSLNKIYPKIDYLVEKHSFADYCSLMYYMMDNNVSFEKKFSLSLVRKTVLSLRRNGARYSDWKSELKYFLYRYNFVCVFKLLKSFSNIRK